MVGREAFLPAAGNRNDTNLNNAGSNGNYWSSSLNTDNPNNAWNVNFNSDNVNRNNNNRYNGQSVRPVSAFTMIDSTPIFDTSPFVFLLDLYRTYKDARREYIIYCDESLSKGTYYSHFYGGVLVKNKDFYRVNTALEDMKKQLNLLGEIKWTKVTAPYRH